MLWEKLDINNFLAGSTFESIVLSMNRNKKNQGSLLFTTFIEEDLFKRHSHFACDTSNIVYIRRLSTSGISLVTNVYILWTKKSKFCSNLLANAKYTK